MNFHSDQWINERVKEHYKEAREHFPYDRILGCFYQGSGNYDMDYKDSDVDTKLIVLPTFKELAMGNQPLSTTHVRANDEHIDFKDLRHYLQIFRKQNMNFLEILFTPYWFANNQYILEWKRLIDAREEIARYSVVRAIKAMQGVAHEKYFAMEHHYPSRMEWINKYSYDPKQLHHLLRVAEFIERYIAGESYQNCLIPHNLEYLVEVKKGLHTLEEAREIGSQTIAKIDKMCKDFVSKNTETTNPEIDVLLDDVQYNILKIAITNEIN